MGLVYDVGCRWNVPVDAVDRIGPILNNLQRTADLGSSTPVRSSGFASLVFPLHMTRNYTGPRQLSGEQEELGRAELHLAIRTRFDRS
jgi:hypothetical protein